MLGECAEIYPEDLAVALPIIDAIHPRIVLEIGTYYGGSARLWQTRYHPEVLITIDERAWTELPYGYQLTGRRSQDPATVAQVADILAGWPVDLLFIDGDHHYTAARADFDLYGPMVRAGGLIVFHDILYRNELNDVPTLWKELKRQYSYVEIAQHPDTSGVGIITQAAPYERTRFGNVT